jgi:hypothetical protein
MLAIMPILNQQQQNIVINAAMAQGYDNNNYGNNNSYYSQYSTDDKKYECRTGPFEGFFVSSVEFCDAKKFDDNKRNHKDNRDNNKTGPQGLPGPAGPTGQQGPAGMNGTNGINGTNGVNGTNIEPCVACLLDALAKLDSGAILVNITSHIPANTPGIPPAGLNITLPLIIDVDVALLLQQQLELNLGLDANATIFDICAAIDETDLSTDTVLADLTVALGPLVTAQITLLVNQFAQAITAITGTPIPPALLATIIASIDTDAIIAQITANVEVSLGILEGCLGLEPTPPTPPTTATLTINKDVFGCNNFIIGNDVMDCSQMTNTDTQWLPCINSAISNFPPCVELPASIFDIEVLDDQDSQLQQFEGSALGTTIENLQPGDYQVNEIQYQTDINQLGASLNDQTTCGILGFDDGGSLQSTNADPNLFYTICIEYEDEQGNDCSTLTLAAGEDKTCTVKNYIRFTNIQL